jgi:hypothetical protein
MTDTEKVWEDAARIVQLESQIRELEGRLSERVKKHEKDIQLIGDALIEEAIDRDWCDEFDKWVENVNQTLWIELPVRAADYVAEITLSVQFRSSPNDVDGVVHDIAQAIYNHGDNHGDHEYTINSSDVSNVERD